MRIDAHCLGRTKCEIRLESRRGFVAVVAMVVVSPCGVGKLPGVPSSSARGGWAAHARLGPNNGSAGGVRTRSAAGA